MMIRAATALIWLSFVTAGNAQTSAPKLLSDSDVEKAQTEIAAMAEPELRSLLNYFAECNDRKSRSEIVKQACKSARVKYQTEFASGRAVDAAIAELEKYIELQNIFRSMGQTPKTDYVDGLEAKLRDSVGAALKAKRG